MFKHRTIFIVAVSAFALCLFRTSAHAHQQWVLPNFFFTDSKEESIWLGFEHTLGDQYFEPSVGPGPALLWVSGPEDGSKAPSFVYTGKTRTLAETELTKPGTYRISAEEPLAHWTRVIEGEKKRWLRMSRDRVKKKKIEVSKRYWAKAITYVTVRTPTNTPLTSLGDPLELLPRDHPNSIRAGQPFNVQVLSDGKPLVGQEIKVFMGAGEGHDAAMTIKSEAKGRAKILFPKPGRYLLTTRYEVETKKDPKADADSYGVYLMVEVQASKGR